MPMPTHSIQGGLRKALRSFWELRPADALLAPQGARTALARLLPALRAPHAILSSPADVLTIRSTETSTEQTLTEATIAQGQSLARQEQWRQLLERIKGADLAREATPSGMPLADLLAFGARADVVNAVEHAISAGLCLNERVTLDGIMSLERVRLDLDRAPLVSTCVAQAHLDIAWACRRHATSRRAAQLNARAQAHLKRAQALLDTLTEDARQSPFIAASKCALYTGLPDTARKMADDYCALIAMSPRNPSPMRALGGHMLRHGGRGVLELEARRTAAMVEDHWGAAGYTWVYFDALAHSDIACETVDVAFFLDGFADIVYEAPHQETINLLAAYCSLALNAPEAEQAASPRATQVRREIAEASTWLIRDHLRELHPMIWAHAAQGFDNDAKISSSRRFAERGHAAALRVIADLFREEIASGHHVIFTDQGPELRLL